MTIPTTVSDVSMINARLSQNGGLTKVRTARDHGTSVYAGAHEIALASANGLLRANGYQPAIVLSRIEAPNFYEVTYVRRHDDHVFGLRLARPANSPIPLALVSIGISGSTDYFDDTQTVFNPGLRLGRALVEKFALRHPGRGHYWLPRFALPVQRQV